MEPWNNLKFTSERLHLGWTIQVCLTTRASWSLTLFEILRLVLLQVDTVVIVRPLDDNHEVLHFNALLIFSQRTANLREIQLRRSVSRILEVYLVTYDKRAICK